MATFTFIVVVLGLVNRPIVVSSDKQNDLLKLIAEAKHPEVGLSAETEGCPFSFIDNGDDHLYEAQTDSFDIVSCEDDKTCEVPDAGNQGLQSNALADACTEELVPEGITCLEVAESWEEACETDESLLQEGYTCGCMSSSVTDGDFCRRTCAECSPILVSKYGFRSGSPEDLDATNELAIGISKYQDALPRTPCEPYDVAVVAESVRKMESLEIPHTVRAAFHDAGDYDKWRGTGGADGRIYNNPEAWYAQSRSVNLGLLCTQKLMGQYKGTSLSPADAIQICGMVATEMAGGPAFEDFDFEPGRVRASGVTRDGLLPGPLGNHKTLRDYFYRMGLDDTDIVALSGAHTLGGGQGNAGSGFSGAFTKNPQEFSNDYFVNLVMYENVTDFDCDYFADGKTPADRVTSRRNTGCHPGGIPNVELQLPSDRALMLDGSLRDLVITYAANQTAFFEQYVKSIKKMSELGRDVSVQWCNYEEQPTSMAPTTTQPTSTAPTTTQPTSFSRPAPPKRQPRNPPVSRPRMDTWLEEVFGN